MSQLNIYSDGGSRGNPGPAAIAFIATNDANETVRTASDFIGVRTNNQAEYEALLMGLKFAIDWKAHQVTCYLDSELVAKQLNGQYTIKNSELQQLNRQVQSLKAHFKKISFVHVARENPQIQRADALLNKTLDEKSGKHPNQNNPLLADNHNREETYRQGAMFVHTSIRVSNIHRSIDFYCRFFGMKVISRREIKQTNAEIVFLQNQESKGCLLELTFYRDQVKFSQPVYEERLFDHLAFEVHELNNLINALKKENVTVTDEPNKFGANTLIAFIEDPDGTLIELIEHK
jgi:lactoylglutathione lyase